tara:strand:+ start:311 stop:514 length:204 start_codon:yes stop_codon:yes gene_type:complete
LNLSQTNSRHVKKHSAGKSHTTIHKLANTAADEVIMYGTKKAKGMKEQLGKKGGKKGTACGKYASRK